MMRLSFNLNGQPVELDCAPDRRLLDIVRESFSLTAAKPGCEIGRCGACVVWLDGAPANACLIMAATLQGRRVDTYESVCRSDASTAVRDALANCGGLQCGYCTPGIAMTLTYLHRRIPCPDAVEAAELASGNLCRCTGYGGIRRAVVQLFPARRQVGVVTCDPCESVSEQSASAQKPLR